jgi:hypothetical protein
VSDAPEKALLEIEVRYCSPLTAAVCRALEAALRRAQQDAGRQRAGCVQPQANGDGAWPSELSVGAS